MKMSHIKTINRNNVSIERSQFGDQLIRELIFTFDLGQFVIELVNTHN